MAQPDLTTPAALKRYLKLTETSDNAVDVLLAEMIRAASRLIRQVTGRRLSVPKETEAREFYVYGPQDRVYLDEVFVPGDIASVVSTTGETIIYEPIPEPPESIAKGMWLHLGSAHSLPLDAYPPDHADFFITELRDEYPVRSIPGRLVVTAEWGYTEIPPEIEWQARMAVKSWYELGIEHFGRSFDAIEGRFIRPEVLPSSVMSALRAWERPDKTVVV